MDRFLSLIVAGDISPRTRETLMKQLDQQQFSVAPAPAPQIADQEIAEMLGLPPQPQQQGRRQAPPPQQQAAINDPVTKIVGLILGSPEFQRQ
jgi:hypothetical protein